MNMREEAFKALATLVGTPTLIDDLSAKKVVDMIEKFGILLVADAYQAGQQNPHRDVETYLKTLK